MGSLTCSSSFMLPGAVCWQKYGRLAAEGPASGAAFSETSHNSDAYAWHGPHASQLFLSEPLPVMADDYCFQRPSGPASELSRNKPDVGVGCHVTRP